MDTQMGTRSGSVAWGKLVRALLLVALLAAFVPFNWAVSQPAPKAQPILLSMAAEQPDQRVAVVVQKQAADANVETVVSGLGGRVTQNLHLINSFVAELPARAVPALAAAHGVRWVSLDAPVVETGKGSTCADCINTSNLQNAYIRAIRADQLWNTAPYLQGQGVGVAVVDSGLSAGSSSDFGTRVLASAKFNSNTGTANDGYGHGTHVAGIVGGNGTLSSGAYIGVAPKVNLINVKVSDDYGAGSISDVVAGLQWIYDNRTVYNIRVVNISLNSSVPESYHTSPLSAAIEILWFNGVVVVVSAGNNGTGNVNNNIVYPPANDPFAITVGAANDKGTPDIGDDSLAPFSAYGTTESGFPKPDLVAPGTNIVAPLASPNTVLATAHPDHIVLVGRKKTYFRMSGTSMSAPVVAATAALLLQDEPTLTPDQVKYRLMATARPFKNGSGAGYLDAYGAVNGTTTASANTGIQPSLLLITGSAPLTWNSVSWNSVSWNSVSWNSVSWNSVSWNSVSWNSVSWGE